MTTALELRRYGHDDLSEIRQTLLDVHAEVYAAEMEDEFNQKFPWFVDHWGGNPGFYSGRNESPSRQDAPSDHVPGGAPSAADLLFSELSGCTLFHPPVDRMRQQQPHPAGDDPHPRWGLSAQFPAPPKNAHPLRKRAPPTDPRG